MKYQHLEAVYGCDWSPHNAYVPTDISTIIVAYAFWALILLFGSRNSLKPAKIRLQLFPRISLETFANTQINLKMAIKMYSDIVI